MGSHSPSAPRSQKDQGVALARTQMEGIDMIIYILILDALVYPAVRNDIATKFILLHFVIVAPNCVIITIFINNVMCLSTFIDDTATVLDDFLPENF